MHSSHISSAQKSPMTSCYKADIGHCHHYRELYWTAFLRWGISQRWDSKCKGPGVDGTLLDMSYRVALLFCSHIPAMPYCLPYTIATLSTLPQANFPKAFADIKF